MSVFERKPTINGVCPFIYRMDDPKKVLFVPELTAKEGSGKLAGQLGPGFETVEPGENHRDAINRFFREEIHPTNGIAFIPDRLEESKLCTIRVSHQELSAEAWVHVYPIPVSSDYVAGQGSFDHEVGMPIWVDGEKVLEIQRNYPQKLLFRAGTSEIIKKHFEKIRNPDRAVFERILHPEGIPPREVYRLMREEGLSQTEALSRHFGNLPQLGDALAWIRLTSVLVSQGEQT